MDLHKPREQLIAELERARQRVAGEEAEAQHRQTERALRDSEERYRSLFQGAQDHLFVLDQNFRYLMENALATSMPAIRRYWAPTIRGRETLLQCI